MICEKCSEKPKRTEKQNSALWLYFTMLADELNSGGLSIQDVLKNYKMEIEWNKNSIHDIVWIPVQKALFGTTSTTKLRKADIDKVYEHINRFVSTMNIHLPFPNDPDRLDKKSMLKGEKIDYPEENYAEPLL